MRFRYRQTRYGLAVPLRSTTAIIGMGATVAPGARLRFGRQPELAADGTNGFGSFKWLHP